LNKKEIANFFIYLVINETPYNASKTEPVVYSELITNDDIYLNYNQIENLKYFMGLVYKNSDFSIKANQLVFYIMNITYYSICEDCETTKDLSEKYYDRIVKNVFSLDDFTNYIKVMYFQFKMNNKDFNMFIGFKYSNEEFKTLLNRAGRNLTVIYKRDPENEESSALLSYDSIDTIDYAIIPCMDYLNFFYKYSFGIDKNMLSQINVDRISYSAYEIQKIHIWNSFSIGKILQASLNIDLGQLSNLEISKNAIFENISDPKNPISFNYNFYKEVLYLVFFLTSSVKENFDKKFGNEVLTKASIYSDLQVSFSQYDKNIYTDKGIELVDWFCYLKIERLNFQFDFCLYKLNKDTHNLTYPFTNANISLFNNIEANDSTDKVTKEILLLKYFNKFDDKYKIFLGSNENTDSSNRSANKSFWIYLSFINGLKMIFFEMLNYENYGNLQNYFVEKIQDNFNLLVSLMISICLIIFFLIFYFSIHFVDLSQKRLMTIVAVKNNIFYKQLAVNYFKDINLFIESGEFPIDILQFITECYERKWKKKDIIDLKDERNSNIVILKQNIFVSIKYGRKLERIVKKVMECNI